MNTTARRRGNLFLRRLLLKVDVFPMPVVAENKELGYFRMVWDFEDVFVDVGSYDDGHFELFVEYTDATETWRGETMIPNPPTEFLKRFLPLCEKPYEQTALSENALFNRRAKPA